ncbi:MAG TPA: RNA 2',3'-cyclic phosphodiesterase [Pyrinomonadaceae bacterium]|nr:RNA 2',3'-cyclic phosphodiesterase [Pyrinomonadaceae bacterium]
MDLPFRTFCAIELSSVVRSRLQQHIDQLRTTAPECHASWSRAENIHLTVKFFGDVQQNSVARMANAAARTVENLSAFEISIAGTGAFPKTSQPRVLWIGIDDLTGKLAELHEQFEKECATEGFPKEGRRFRPHLTIARIRKPEGARAVAELNQTTGFESISLTVNELVVFRSELSSKGSTYTALSRHKLSDML